MLSIIAIHGQAQTGKDTVCQFLKEILNNRTKDKWIRTAFADAVKKVFCESFHVDLDFIEKWKVIDEPPPGFLIPVRKALQIIGTGFRNIVTDCWINKVFEDNKNKHCIISDGRFLNEAKSVINRNGINVVIWRGEKFENNDPNPSESEIYKVIKLCLNTEQNGPIDYNRIENENLDLIKNYHYFLRNDKDKNDLYENISKNLLDFITKN